MNEIETKIDVIEQSPQKGVLIVKHLRNKKLLYLNLNHHDSTSYP